MKLADFLHNPTVSSCQVLTICKVRIKFPEASAGLGCISMAAQGFWPWRGYECAWLEALESCCSQRASFCASDLAHAFRPSPNGSLVFASAEKDQRASVNNFFKKKKAISRWELFPSNTAMRFIWWQNQGLCVVRAQSFSGCAWSRWEAKPPSSLMGLLQGENQGLSLSLVIVVVPGRSFMLYLEVHTCCRNCWGSEASVRLWSVSRRV